MSATTVVLLAFFGGLVCVVLLIGLLIIGGTEPRSSVRKRAPEGDLHRYECTCGWHGWRTLVIATASFKCPRCNGVAVRRSYRESIE